MRVLISILWLLDILAFFAAIVLLIIRAVKKQPKKPFVIMAVVTFIAFFVLTLLFPSSDDSRENPKSDPTVANDSESQSASSLEPETSSSSLSSSASSTSSSLASSSDSSSTNNNPLYDIEIKTADVISGIGNNKVGTRAWIEVPKQVMLGLTQEQMMEYARNEIDNGYNWFTIFMDDGTGMIFRDTYALFEYGTTDSDGGLIDRIGMGIITDKNIGYNYEVLEDTEPAPESSSKSEPSSQQNDTAALSLEDISLIFNDVILTGIDGHDVSYDDAGLTVNIWQDGLAVGIIAIQSTGGGSDDENWVMVKENLTEMASSMREVLDDSGQENALLVINLLNDLAHDKVFLTLLNDTIIYDVLE